MLNFKQGQQRINRVLDIFPLGAPVFKTEGNLFLDGSSQQLLAWILKTVAHFLTDM